MTRDPQFECFRERTNREPLWLVVHREGKTTTYEFGPDGDTTVVVGSSTTAQIGVADAAPIVFYLERLGDALCLIPCYAGTPLRVNGEVVRARRRIVGRVVVELGALRLELQVRDTPPTVPGDPVGQEASGGSVAFPSSSGHAVSSESHAAIHQLRTVTLERDDLLRLGVSPLETQRTISLDPDSWFDATFSTAAPEAIERQASARVRSSAHELERIGLPPRPPPSPSTSRFDPMKTRELTLTRTVELEPMTRVSSSTSAPTSVDRDPPRPRLAPPSELYRTVELLGVDAVGSAPSARPRRSGPEITNQTVEISVPAMRHLSDTTDFEVPAVKGTFEQSVHESCLANAPGAQPIATSASGEDTTPRSGEVQFEGASHTELDSQKAPSRRRLISRVAEVIGALKPAAAVELLRRLGVLTSRRPVLMLGVVSLGSLLLVLCLLGAAHLLGRQARQISDRQYAARGASTVASAPSIPAVRASSAAAEAPSAADSIAAAPRMPGEGTQETSSNRDTTVAVGHLFAGRLPEAEQSYSELSARFPADSAFRAAAGILRRRNGPNCRSASDAKLSCPTVKP